MFIVAALRRSANVLNLAKTAQISVVTQPIVNRRSIHFIINKNVAVNYQHGLLANAEIQNISHNITRNVIKFSIRKGKRKSVKAVTTRFYRLNWGGWIRTKAGRAKKLWKKTTNRKVRLRQHVFCNGQQSYLLDKMVGPYWRKPRYYVDDIYNPYHTREEFFHTAKKPRPFVPMNGD